MAWTGAGARETNGYVVVAQWLCVVNLLVVGVAAIAAVAERRDVIAQERGLAQIDILAGIALAALYGASADLRSAEPGNAAPSPSPFLPTIAALVVPTVDA